MLTTLPFESWESYLLQHPPTISFLALVTHMITLENLLVSFAKWTIWTTSCETY